MRSIHALAAVLFAISFGAAATARAQRVAIVTIEDTVTYGPEVARIGTTLTAAGATVTTFHVTTTSAALPSLDTFQQIWWIDLTAGPDTAAPIVAAATRVGQWYVDRGRPHAILDARILSSVWTTATPPAGELALLRNYLRALQERGGGLLVGTAWSMFANAANRLLAQIGMNPIEGRYYSVPLSASVAPAHALWSYPEVAWHPCVESCGGMTGGAWIYDNSSTGYPPTGTQPSGVELYPVAWHGGNTSATAVSVTFLSPAPLVARITAPADAAQHVAFSAGPITLTGTATGGVGPYTYAWSSSASGSLGSGATRPLPSTSPSPQTITLRVTDAGGRTATDTIVIYSGFCTAAAHCPGARTCVDGVCCNDACGGGAADCRACSVASGGATDGTCGPLRAAVASTTTCRASAGACDPAETCSATSTACPANVLAAPGTTCRAAVGACDVAETCTGTASCPADALVAAGTICRSAAGICDAAEACTGAATACPTDLSVADGSPCADAIACDGAEVCQAGACTSGAPIDCDDGDLCTSEACTEPDGACEHTPIDGCCNLDSDCDDGEVCTADACSGPGGTCSHTAVPECCHASSECDDGDPCTDDACEADACTHTDACTDAGVDASVSDDASVSEDASLSEDASVREDASAGGDAGRLDAGDAMAASSGGCACRAGAGSQPVAAAWLALAALGLAIARRRARR
ncbi:MYXO-CTERM sorting domain-containing protein [Sandaracinus amylolyticus]|uniref:MYXO-CTERM sorting domain-containing protein n=1 Tax=Sandaracinus amylolyticus TaxID=927083 RepID=UPI001F3B878E|nr:MYXO-CTERM sorting domain-containing protein [Sandaracinus amylolyticus]UJR78537.1 Disintegrin domain-containing protein [Sandaracinus amylolyticus]